MSELWKCDGRGCTVQGTLDEVNTHIESQMLDADGEFKKPQDIVCWGAFRIKPETTEQTEGVSQ